MVQFIAGPHHRRDALDAGTRESNRLINGRRSKAMTDRSDRAGGDGLEGFHEEIRGAVLDAAESFRNGGDVRDMHRILAEGAKRALASPPSGNAGEGAKKLVPPVCCYCDADLSCSKCGREQPADHAAPPQPAPDALREDIAKALAYDLENGSAHGARVATTPHMDNYHVNGHINLLALADAVLAFSARPTGDQRTPQVSGEPADGGGVGETR
jgi:hypothetical protein